MRGVMRVAWFSPILAGGTWRDRCIAGAGAGAGIAIVAGSGLLLSRAMPGVGAIALPLGASAVLVFAGPASPLAQPWSVVGGNSVSAAVGLVIGGLIGDPTLAAGLAVALAILTMSLARCLHPPGGAMALTAALGGSAAGAAGPLYPLVPVLVQSALLVAAGLAFHRVSGHSYPHVPPAAPPARPSFEAEDVDRALAETGETYDIDRDDLAALLRAVLAQARRRG